MTNGKTIIASGLGLMLLLAAVVDAQESAPKNPQSPPPLDAEALADSMKAEAAAALMESAYQGRTPPEGARMLIAILRDAQLLAGKGWFGPAQTRYSWKWLARSCRVDPAKGTIARKQFPGSDAYFACLDRNKDGVLTSSDLDFSESKPATAASPIGLLKVNDASCAVKPADAPTRDVLIRSFFTNEIGSMNEGPKLNEPAPKFTLKTVDGKNTVCLEKLLGSKPVVLVFGSFT